MSAYNFAVYLILIFMGFYPSLCLVFLRLRVGQRATLNCNCQNNDIVMCYWYKQANGQKPEKMTSYSKLNLKVEFKVNPRFAVNNTNNYNNLEIKDVQVSDAATYFCMSSNLYNLDFLEAITLDIEGAGFHFKTLVFELMPENSSILGSATLECSFDNVICDREHKVYWFRPSEESSNGVFYSQRGTSDQCESKTDSPTDSCVYDLPKHHTTRDWTKCAVASCGKLLFGTKSKADSEDKDMASFLVYLLTGALVVPLILSLLFALAIYKIKKKSPPTVTVENEEDVHYAALRHHTSNRARGPIHTTNTECVYSGVRHY